MSFIHNNISALFISLVACGFAWIWGGIRGEYILRVVPWLWALMFEVMVCFPQKQPGEPSKHARERVWLAMRGDPMVWTVVAFLVLLAVPFVNRALCPNCDAALIAQGFNTQPPVKFLPFCLNRMHHLNVYLWFLPALTAAVAAKHSLTRSGKRRLVEIVVWNGVLLSVLGFVQQVTGAKAPFWTAPHKYATYFFSTFGYPNMAGSYFAMLFCLSVAVWREHVEAVRRDMAGAPAVRSLSKYRLFWKKHYPLIPSLITFFAALSSLSRAGIILVSTAAVVLFLHAGIVFLSRMKKADRVRAGAFCALGIVVIALAGAAFMPDELQKELDSIGTTEVLDRVTGKGEHHAGIAVQLWKEHPVFGCGGWGYKHLCASRLPESVKFGIKAGWGFGGANVHNDYLQFMVEHGTVGFVMLVAIVAMLLAPVCRAWKRLSLTARFLPVHRQPPPPQALFALPGGAFAMLAAATVPLVHAFGDCPLRSPAVLTLFFVTLACTTGFLPHEHHHDSNDEETNGRE